MCYKDNVPPLSFEGMRLVCLCGDNGNGKSALLDAMTWALWGRARGRTNDELLHTGQSDMEVDLEFAVGELLYRVVRKYSRSRVNRPGYGSLDFQMRNNDGYVPMSGATIHETEAGIKKVLRTDYDTFINSAYLVQGRADEFTQKRPAERKQVLADILGLSLYDSYEEMAKAARRDREKDRIALDREIELKAKKLEEMDGCRSEFDRVETGLADLEQRMAAHQAEMESLEKSKGELEVKKGQVEVLGRGLKDLELELAAARQQVQDHAEKVRRFELALAQEQEVERGYGEWRRLTEENAGWNEKLRLGLDLTRRINELDRRIGEARARFEKEREMVCREMADAEKTVAGLPALLESQRLLHDSLEALSRFGQELDRKRQLGAEAEADVRSLSAANLCLEAEIKGLRDKLGMLQVPTLSGLSPSGGDIIRCPLCESELGLEGKARLDGNYKAQIQQKAEAHRLNLDAIQERRRTQLLLKNEAAAAEQKLKAENLQKQKELASIAGKIQGAERAREQLAAKVERKRELDGILATGAFAPAEQKMLGELAEKEKAIGYDQARHAAVREGLKEYSKYEALKKSLDEARASLAHERELLLRAGGHVQEKAVARDERLQARAMLEQETAALPGITRQWQDKKAVLLGLSREKEAAGKKYGELKGRLDDLTRTEREKQRNEIERQRLSEEEKIYGDLALYFGKKGIQAMLIETAIPEIEERANELLGRLTENRLSLKIETQKSRKTSAAVEETLEIKIADELGTRDYALFSGGEAFRINFALRLALSRLLARRAGAPLPTLIVDEGFGTQDREGRERLVEAINSIKDDFEKIIVITHIDELKEAFPVRIEVTKGPDGSMFTIV
ncbi:MAG: SMC family ATPase [Chloroflexi bacterium]|nr:SMC family ATPase [Chloroflexota bacterium]